MEWCQRVNFNFLWLGKDEGQPEEDRGGGEKEDDLLPRKISPLGPICLVGAGSNEQQSWNNLDACEWFLQTLEKLGDPSGGRINSLIKQGGLLNPYSFPFQSERPPWDRIGGFIFLFLPTSTNAHFLLFLVPSHSTRETHFLPHYQRIGQRMGLYIDLVPEQLFPASR